MAEAVRFYWRGREVDIPLIEIPEIDRSPLKVRRSVVQAFAPDILKHLEDGRFVAAAWRSSNSIFLILCHPNLAKGIADALLLDSSALPRLVVKVETWEEVPEAVRLFLTAFGSESASVDECVAARRDLINWLTEHGQPEMAAAARHFSVFPFSVRSDALEIINSWRHVLVKGHKDQIDQFLGQVRQRFASLGWSRDTVVEGQMNRDEYQRNRFYCWISRPESKPRVLLCLNRATDRRVRGGTYNIDERGGLTEIGSAIEHVLREVLEPAAATVGLEVSYPRLGPISRVGTRTEAAITALAEAADGQSSFPADVEPLWRTFVLTAFQEDVALNPEELAAWFAASGWNEQASAELTKRFYTEAALLGEYEEARRQSA